MSEPLATPSFMPKLRFPGFDATWNQGTVGEVVATITPPRKLQTSEYRLEGGYPIVDQSQSDVAGWTNDKSALVEVESSLIVFGDHTCALKRVVRPFAQGADGIKILKALPGLSTDFVYQSLTNKPLLMEEYKRHFSALTIRPITWPADMAEQRQITDCLQSLDELIALEVQKLYALKRYKKGLLQQLFPAEGEITPRLRFPRFNGEWNRVALGSIMQGLGSGRSTNDVSGEWKLYGSTGVIGLTNDAPYSGECILIARVGANAGLLTYLESQRFGASDNTLVLTIGSEASTAFTFSYLNSLNLNALAFGSSQPLVTGSQLKAVMIPLPSRSEQTMIADVLSNFDLLESQTTALIAMLRTHKTALLQQLFPAIDEAEG